MSRSLSECCIGRRIGALALSIGVAVLSSLVVAVGFAAANGPSATGSGHFQSSGALRTFAFSAVTHQDGSVTGQAQLKNRAQDTTDHLATQREPAAVSQMARSRAACRFSLSPALLSSRYFC